MENISKFVITLGGEKIGYVLDLALNGLDKVGYYIADEETESEHFLRREEIVAISDVVVISDVSKLEFVAVREPSVLGREVFDEKGNFLGVVKNLTFNKNGKCQKIETDKCEILAKYVKAMSKNCVVVSFAKKRMKVKEAVFDKQFISEQIVQTQQVLKPEKINLSPSAFVGKVCLQEVIGYNNERVVAKGEIVTKNIFEKARRHNKLNELFFSLKR